MNDRIPETPDDGAMTPMMVQYLAIKADNPGCLLFYRMGDFYELFFEDAVEASRALDIALTKRGRHLGQDIPMCGVPVHSHEAYLARLIRKGFRVAVCEQMEDPAQARKRGGKALVRRDVVRVVTRGTLTEESLLDARRHNYLAALAEAERRLGFAWIDISTGEFQIQAAEVAGLGAVLARLDAGEILVPDALYGREGLAEILGDWKERLTLLPASRFDSENGRRRLEAQFGVRALDAYGGFTRAEIAAGGALVDYVELTQKGKVPRIAPPRRLAEGAVLEIDAATRRNLELAETLSGERKGSLLSVIDETVSGPGARLLARHLAAPLTDVRAIEDRLDMVHFFVADERIRGAFRTLAGGCPDLERALGRLTVGRGSPRDLAAIRDGLDGVFEVRELLAGAASAGLPTGIGQAMTDLGFHQQLAERLRQALAAELPPQAREGGFIAPGHAPELDELRLLRDESRRLIAGLQARYVGETGVPSLKIQHNRVLGYFIEVPEKHADKVPFAPGDPFIHRQTMNKAVRFTTVELGELEGRIAQAADKALALELRLFENLVADVAVSAEAIALAARALAGLDLASALAELAVKRRYVRPVLTSGLEFDITSGRHPVVEAALERGGQGAFVANDCRLDPDRQLWLLTGPNMAGKSTFLRQNALIAILAQMGSFVPAEAARIGVIDRLFSRVGAADDLARGRSTFMVEMVETAAILNQAGPRSLVILDEIGRGTATFDGLSIAWAVVEHLHKVNRSRTLFATHYHELTHLASKLSCLACQTMRVKEWQGDVVFLHEVAPGAADRSYGIHVGRMAGLPAAVVARAEAVLETLEKGDQSSAVARLADDLPLFAAAATRRAPTAPAAPEPSAVEQALAEVHPDGLTPREALELIYRLKGLMAGG